MNTLTRWLASAAVLAGLGLSGCGKKQEATAAAGGGGSRGPATVSDWQRRYGFAGRIPKDVEFYGACFDLGRELDGLWKSRFWASLVSNPLFADLREAYESGSPEERAKFEVQKAVATGLLGTEWFLAGGPGGAAGLAWFGRLADEIRIAQVLAAMPPGDSKEKPDAEQRAVLEVFRRNADALAKGRLAPVLIGFRAGQVRASIESLLTEWEAKLPVETEKSEVEGPGGAKFRSWVFTGRAFLEGPGGESIRQWLVAALGGDEESARPLLEALGAQRVEIAAGWLEDYLLVSIGADRSALKLATSPADSILALPEMGVAAGFADQRLVGVAYASRDAMESARRKVELAPLVRQVADALGDLLQPESVKSLLADAERLDARGRSLWGSAETLSAFTVSGPHGWRTESFGGLRRGGFDLAGKLPAWRLPESAVIEWRVRRDEAYGSAFTGWFEDLCATAWKQFKAIAARSLPAAQAQQLEQLEVIALPQLGVLWGILRDQFAKSLGPGGALVFDLEGALPSGALPNLPEALAGRPLFPRAAVVREVRDAALLDRSWESLFARAKGLAAFVPPMVLPGGELPGPMSRKEGDLTLHYYSLPMETGDLLPHVARRGSDLALFSTSPSLSKAIAEAEALAASETGGSQFRLRLTPLWAAGGRWIEAAGANPEVWFGEGKVSEREAFLRNRAHLIALLESLRAVEGFEIRTWEESGRQRQSASLVFRDLQ